MENISAKILPSYRAACAARMRELTRPSAARTLLAVGGDWLVIFGAAWVSGQARSLPVYLAALVLIASRQHALLVLFHEAAHGHLFRSRWLNDLCGRAFTGLPFGMSLERYREHHWKHHQYTNTPRDPDWGRKVEHPAWQFPKSPARFWRGFLPYLYGMGLVELWFARKVIGVDRPGLHGALVFYALAAAGLTAAGAWAQFALYWVLPYFLLVPPLMKVRSIAEHLALPNRGELTASRNIVGSPVESFFFGPHGNSLHLIHHLFPQVPWHRVEGLREELLRDESFRNGAHENIGYFLPWEGSVYRDLVKDEPEGGAFGDTNDEQQAA